MSTDGDSGLMQMTFDSVLLDDVAAYLVTYRDGELLDQHGTEPYGFPRGVFGNGANV